MGPCFPEIVAKNPPFLAIHFSVTFEMGRFLKQECTYLLKMHFENTHLNDKA